MPKILLLGGTREARKLAGLLADDPRYDAILSLAGVTSTPPETGLAMRIGGFGGAEGMAQWITDHGVTTIIDATHPYAAGISANAACAAEITRARRLCLWRPPWQAEPDDHWQEYDGWAGLVSAIPDKATVFLTAGQDGIRAFAGADRFDVVARALENPVENGKMTFIGSLPSRNWQDEAALFSQYGITHLVAKNSGGISSLAKLVAARQMGLPVLMLARPSPPPSPLFDDIETLMQHL